MCVYMLLELVSVVFIKFDEVFSLGGVLLVLICYKLLLDYIIDG